MDNDGASFATRATSGPPLVAAVTGAVATPICDDCMHYSFIYHNILSELFVNGVTVTPMAIIIIL